MRLSRVELNMHTDNNNDDDFRSTRARFFLDITCVRAFLCFPTPGMVFNIHALQHRDGRSTFISSTSSSRP